MPHPFQFGLSTNAASSAEDLTKRARRYEDLGYYSLLIQDHYLGPGPALTAAQHPAQTIAAIPTAALAAAATTRLVVGFRVLCVDYHHPIVLAKELATLDLFSGGRLEIGLGAGWMSSEYAALGITMATPGLRLRRVAEAAQLIDQFFTADTVEHDGEFYRATGFSGLPRPCQKPRPPIAIGGGGPVALHIAGAHADIVSINLDMRAGAFSSDTIARSATSEMRERLEWIRGGAGERFADLTLEIGAHFVALTARANTDDERAKLTRLPADVARDFPHALVGTVDSICETLEERREQYGLSYITIQERAAEMFAPVVARLAGR